ncbi:MAG: hypothetical protein IT310_14415, partial [Anaerolineales bacterium]|nr:hypothetical protein [Anaerolineales bacterium]
TAANPNTQYAPYVFARLLGIDPARLFVLKLFQWVGFGVAFCNLLLLWFVQKSKLDSDGLISITLLFCTLPFLIETAWHHYFIFLPFIQFVFFKSAEKSAKLYAALSAILSSVFIYNFFSSWENYAQWGFSFFSALAILICVYQTVFNNWRSQRRAYAQL